MKRHALLIALSEYIQPGDRRWASEAVDSETRDPSTAPRGGAQEGLKRQASGHRCGCAARCTLCSAKVWKSAIVAHTLGLSSALAIFPIA